MEVGGRERVVTGGSRGQVMWPQAKGSVQRLEKQVMYSPQDPLEGMQSYQQFYISDFQTCKIINVY